MLDRLTGMQVFARVASHGSLSAAARALGMSQTMATKHVAALEARLGVKLLHRTTRRLTLTEAGRNYLDAAERILADFEEADAAALAETAEVRGTIRLNVPVSFGTRQIAPLISQFLKIHPALTIELGLNDRHVDLIDEGWDMVIRIGDMTGSDLKARRIAGCSMIVCAAPSYMAEHGRPQTVADLADHNCLQYTLSRVSGEGTWIFGLDRKIKIQVTGGLKANNGDALVAAAIAGQGIVYQPAFLVAREIAAGLLIPLELDHAPMQLDGIYAAYPAQRRPPAKVRAMIDFLVAQFGSHPGWDKIQS